MSTPAPQQSVRQERDQVRVVLLLMIVVGTALFSVALVLWAALELRSEESALGAIQPSRVRGTAPPAIGGVTQTLIDVDTAAARERDGQKERLESWRWLDRARGILQIPIERAMDALVEDNAAHRGGARSATPLERAKIEERPGVRLPLDLSLRDQPSGHIRLGDAIIGDTPTLLVFADYDCGMLCGLVLDGAARALRESGLRIGQDYRALTVGIDPRDDADMAGPARRHMLDVVGAPAASDMWPFLAGDEPAIHELADRIGFRFSYDAATDQFAHPAALFVITADGRVSSYLYGIQFEAAKLREALERARRGEAEASAGALLIRCFRYIPALTRHAGLIRAVLWTGAIATVTLLAAMLIRLWRADFRRGRAV